MRIGIDGSCWSNQRGFGRFTRCLVTEMVARHPQHEYEMVIDAPSAAEADLPDGVEVEAVELGTAPSVAAAADGSRRPVDMLRMGLAARRVDSDAFFFPASYSYYYVPGRKVVVTLHDAIAEDLPELVVPSRADRWRWQMKQKLALYQAQHLVTVSDAARADIERRFGVRPAHLTVVHEAPDPKFAPLDREARAGALARFGLEPDDRYIVYVGGISPHKNLVRLVQALALARREHPDLRLLLVGEADDDPFLSSTTDVRNAIEATDAPDSVVLTGRVSDDDLIALYSGALASILPSLGEGFGLTAAESVACGTPVVASDLPALRELLSACGTFVDPHDPASIAEGIGSLVADRALREERAAAGLARAMDWSWAGAADTVVGVLERVAAA